MKKVKIIGLIFLILSLSINLFLSIYKLNVSIWLDEAFSFKYASYNFFEILTQSMIFDTHVPMYYLFLNIWIKIFGSSEIALRMPSVIFGHISIVLLYFTLDIVNLNQSNKIDNCSAKKNILNYVENFFCVIFFSIHLSLIIEQRDARMYSMLLMFAILSTFLLILYFYHNKLIYLILYTIFSILFVYTHVFAIFLFPCHILYWFIKRRNNIKEEIKYMASSYLIISLSIIPIIIFLSRLTQRSFLLTPLTLNKFMDFINSLFYDRNIGITWAFTLFIILFCLYFIDKKKFEVTMFILVILILPFVFVFIYEEIFNAIYSPKYLIYTVPIGILLIAKSISGLIIILNNVIDKIIQFSKQKLKKLYLIIKGKGITTKHFYYCSIIIILFISSSFIIYKSTKIYINYYQSPEKQNWKGVANYIRNNYNENDYILIEAGFCEVPFKYYYSSNLTENNIISVTFINSTEIINSITNYLNGSRVWYILSHSRDYNNEIYNWASSENYLINYQEFKAIRLLLIDNDPITFL